VHHRVVGERACGEDEASGGGVWKGRHERVREWLDHDPFTGGVLVPGGQRHGQDAVEVEERARIVSALSGPLSPPASVSGPTSTAAGRWKFGFGAVMCTRLCGAMWSVLRRTHWRDS
jgi:hypothetical protein